MAYIFAFRRKIRLGKGKPIKIDAIIGCKYTSIFKVEKDSSCLVKNSELPENERWEFVGQLKSEEEEEEKNNSSLVQDQNHQKLTQETIEEMKKNRRIDGSQIVDAIITSSSTFETKTQFSQQKYIKKKQAKYLMYLKVLRPTACLVAELLYSFKPDKIL